VERARDARLAVSLTGLHIGGIVRDGLPAALEVVGLLGYVLGGCEVSPLLR
jgi:hypothetical protein